MPDRVSYQNRLRSIQQSGMRGIDNQSLPRISNPGNIPPMVGPQTSAVSNPVIDVNKRPTDYTLPEDSYIPTDEEVNNLFDIYRQQAVGFVAESMKDTRSISDLIIDSERLAANGVIAGATGIGKLVKDSIKRLMPDTPEYQERWARLEAGDQEEQLRLQQEAMTLLAPYSRPERAAMMAISSVIQMAPFAISAIMTGGTTAGSFAAAVMSGGQKYSQLRGAGLEDYKALGYASAYGAMEYIGEKFTLGALTKPESSFVRRFADYVFTEAVSEEITTIGQFLIDKGTIDKDASLADFFRQLGETAVVTAIAAPLNAGIYHPLVRIKANGQQIIDTPLTKELMDLQKNYMEEVYRITDETMAKIKKQRAEAFAEAEKSMAAESVAQQSFTAAETERADVKQAAAQTAVEVNQQNRLAEAETLNAMRSAQAESGDADMRAALFTANFDSEYYDNIESKTILKAMKKRATKLAYRIGFGKSNFSELSPETSVTLAGQALSYALALENPTKGALNLWLMENIGDYDSPFAKQIMSDAGFLNYLVANGIYDKPTIKGTFNRFYGGDFTDEQVDQFVDIYRGTAARLGGALDAVLRNGELESLFDLSEEPTLHDARMTPEFIDWSESLRGLDIDREISDNISDALENNDFSKFGVYEDFKKKGQWEPFKTRMYDLVENQGVYKSAQKIFGDPGKPEGVYAVSSFLKDGSGIDSVTTNLKVSATEEDIRNAPKIEVVGKSESKKKSLFPSYRVNIGGGTTIIVKSTIDLNGRPCIFCGDVKINLSEKSVVAGDLELEYAVPETNRASLAHKLKELYNYFTFLEDMGAVDIVKKAYNNLVVREERAIDVRNKLISELKESGYETLFVGGNIKGTIDSAIEDTRIYPDTTAPVKTDSPAKTFEMLKSNLQFFAEEPGEVPIKSAYNALKSVLPESTKADIRQAVVNFEDFLANTDRIVQDLSIKKDPQEFSTIEKLVMAMKPLHHIEGPNISAFVETYRENISSSIKQLQTLVTELFRPFQELPENLKKIVIDRLAIPSTQLNYVMSEAEARASLLDFTDEDAAKMYQGYRAINETMQAALMALNEEAAIASPGLEKILKGRKLEYYVPLSRERKKYYVAVQKNGDKPQTVYSATFNTLEEVDKAVSDIREGRSQLFVYNRGKEGVELSRYSFNSDEFTISAGESDKYTGPIVGLLNDIFGLSGNKKEVSYVTGDTLLDSILTAIDKIDLDVEQRSDIKERITKIARAQSDLNSHFIYRSGVAGYDPAFVEQNINRVVAMIANKAGRLKTINVFNSFLDENPALPKDTKGILRTYIDGLIKSPTTLDRAVGTASYLSIIKYMGLNLMTSVREAMTSVGLNFLAGGYTGVNAATFAKHQIEAIANTARFVTNKLKEHGLFKQLTHDEWASLLSRSGFNDETVEAIISAKERGFLESTSVDEYADYFSPDNAVFAFLSKSMEPFRMTERTCKLFTYAALYNASRSGGMTVADAAVTADRTILKIQGQPGREGKILAAYNKDTGWAYRLFTSLQGWTINQFWTNAGIGRELLTNAVNAFDTKAPADIKPEARKNFVNFASNYLMGLTYLMLMGGAASMPFLKDILDKMRELSGSPDAISKLSQSDNVWHRAMANGLPTLLGLRLENNFGFPPVSLLEGGSITSMFSDIYSGLGKLYDGDGWKGVEKLAPSVIARTMRQMRLFYEGETTPSGMRVINPETGRPYKSSIADALASVAGLRLDSESTRRIEGAFIAGQLQSGWQDYKNSVVKSVRKDLNSGKLKEALKKRAEFNRDLVAYYRKHSDFIKKTLHGRFVTPITDVKTEVTE